MIPDKWYIKITPENREKVKEYFSEKYPVTKDYHYTDNMLYSNNTSQHSSCSPHLGYKEIQIEDLVDTIPEKWCVERNVYNYKIINKWASQKGKTYWSDCSYMHSESLGISNYDLVRSKPLFPIITFEQFKKHVLKENTMQTTTRRKLLTILDVDNCGDFNSAIRTILKENFDRTEDTPIYISQVYLDRLTKEGSEKQKQLVLNIGIYIQDNTLDSLRGDKIHFEMKPDGRSMIAISCSTDMKNRAYYLNHNFDWELKTIGFKRYLIPSRK